MESIWISTGKDPVATLCDTSLDEGTGIITKEETWGKLCDLLQTKVKSATWRIGFLDGNSKPAQNRLWKATHFSGYSFYEVLNHMSRQLNQEPTRT